jgi:hypothetical protein
MATVMNNGAEPGTTRKYIESAVKADGVVVKKSRPTRPPLPVIPWVTSGHAGPSLYAHQAAADVTLSCAS